MPFSSSADPCLLSSSRHLPSLSARGSTSTSKPANRLIVDHDAIIVPDFSVSKSHNPQRLRAEIDIRSAGVIILEILCSLPYCRSIPMPKYNTSRLQAVRAELAPMIPMPTNANTMHRPPLCVSSSAWLNSCSATDASMPATAANMAP
jgi:hypothetical protein